MEDDAEISSLRQQLEQLNKEDTSLKKRTEVDDLRRQVAEKKSVAALRGNTHFKNKALSQLTKLLTKSDDVTILTLSLKKI